MRHFILYLTLFISGFGFSQTKVIAHKSHSGSSKTFKTALTVKSFNSANSNFGEPIKKKLTKVEREKISKDLTNKQIDVSYEREQTTTKKTIELTLIKSPEADFAIYLNDKKIKIPKNPKDNFKMVLKLKKGERNYLIFDNPKKPQTNEVCSPIKVNINVSGVIHHLWSDNYSSSAVIIDQVAK